MWYNWRTVSISMNKKNKETRTIEAIIRISPKKGGFLYDEEKDQDVLVPIEALNTALHEDVVQVALTGKKDRLPLGRVTKVVRRGRKELVGTLIEKNGDFIVEARNMYTPLTIAKSDLNEAHVGDKVLATINEWKGAHLPLTGTIKKKIGAAGDHNTEMLAIVFDKGFTPEFSPAVEREAREIKERYPKLLAQEEKVRRDMRGTTTFTIDPEDAKDFDDALSVEKLPNGNTQVGVHIADPTFFIHPHTPIDRVAAERTTSIYLVDRTIPMLPEVLSNDLCSLNPNEDKLTFSAIFEITPQGSVVDRWFGRTIIHSDRRFTYKEAQNTIDAGSGELYDELATLDTLAKKIRAERGKNGAIEFAHDEVYFTLDEKGKPISVYRKEPLGTHKLIEEFMILANQEVARFMTERDDKVKSTFVYRVHDLPDEDKVREVIRLLHILGYEVPKRQKDFTLQDINQILDTVAGGPHEEMVQMATIQSMSKAIYTTKNIGHFGLSLKYYTHFTSPIRRYPDMMVHRLMAMYLAGEEIPAEGHEIYEAISRYATQMEIAATKAQRESIKYKQTEYMADRVGTAFAGTVTGVTERGIFVREDDSLAEGLVQLRDLRDDYYSFEPESFSIVGKNKKKRYSLGDSVKIKVTNVNLERRLIDYTIV